MELKKGAAGNASNTTKSPFEIWLSGGKAAEEKKQPPDNVLYLFGKKEVSRNL